MKIIFKKTAIMSVIAAMFMTFLIYNFEMNQAYLKLFSLLVVILSLILFLSLNRKNNLIRKQRNILSHSLDNVFDYYVIFSKNLKAIYVSESFKDKFPFPGDYHENILDILVSRKVITSKIRNKLEKSIKNGENENINIETKSNFGYLKHSFILNKISKENDSKFHLFLSSADQKSDYMILSSKVENTMKNYQEQLDDFNIGYLVIDNDKITNMNNYLANLIGYENKSIDKLTIEDLFARKKDIKSINSDVEIGQIQLKHKKGSIIKTISKIYNNPSYNQKEIIFIGDNAEFSNYGKGSNSKEFIDIFEHSRLPSAIIDGKGMIDKTNFSFRELTDEKKVKGWNIFAIIDDSCKEQVAALFLDIVTGKEKERQPIDVKIKSKKDKVVSLYVDRFTDKKTDEPFLMCHLIDATDQKNLEMHFAHSQKMQAVGQLAGGVAHDFNNLLTAMIGFCDLLLIKHPPGDNSFSDIIQIKQNANRAANLVRQLLAFSRRQTLQPEILNLNDIISEISSLVRRLISENIDFTLNHSSDSSYVKVDQGQLEQVIVNLAINARDAMPEGGSLKISTRNVIVNKANPIPKEYINPLESEEIIDGEYALIEVSDSGTGMDDELITKIFEPFFSTKEMGEGTGLGLATVFGFVKQSGGYIYVTSKLGIGTKFVIYLKRHDKKVELESEDNTKLELVSNDLTGEGMILLVEDENPVRMFSANALKNKGYNVLEAESAEAAKVIIESEGDNIDLIISDVMMPGTNGPQMVQEVLKDRPNMKVIFISGYAEETFRDALGDGKKKYNFLSKPYTLKQLASKVKEVIDE